MMISGLKAKVMGGILKAQTAHLPGLAPPGGQDTTAARVALEREKRRRMMAANTTLGAGTYSNVGSGMFGAEE